METATFSILYTIYSLPYTVYYVLYRALLLSFKGPPIYSIRYPKYISQHHSHNKDPNIILSKDSFLGPPPIYGNSHVKLRARPIRPKSRSKSRRRQLLPAPCSVKPGKARSPLKGLLFRDASGSFKGVWGSFSGLI